MTFSTLAELKYKSDATLQQDTETEIRSLISYMMVYTFLKLTIDHHNSRSIEIKHHLSRYPSKISTLNVQPETSKVCQIT